VTIAFANLPPWQAAGWVMRGFCQRALPHLAELPHVAEEIEDCLESGIFHISLREASPEMLDEMHRLIERVINATAAEGERGFADPSGYPAFMAKLAELEQLSARARTAATAPSAVGLTGLPAAPRRTVDGGRVVVEELLVRDSFSDGMWRGSLTSDFRQKRLITLGGRQSRPYAELRSDLELAVDGVAALEYLGPVDEPDDAGWRGDCIVEVEPRGVRAIDQIPVSERAAIAIGVGACELLERAHARSLVLRGIRPELLYMSSGLSPAFTGLAPRADVFLDTARPPSSGMRSLATPYRAPEDFLRRRPEAASDVFALCATLFHLVTGRHPFGSEWPEQIARIQSGAAEPWASPLGTVVLGGLAPDPNARPPAVELRRALRTLLGE
jgi:hypothetical protein